MFELTALITFVLVLPQSIKKRSICAKSDWNFLYLVTDFPALIAWDVWSGFSSWLSFVAVVYVFFFRKVLHLLNKLRTTLIGTFVGLSTTGHFHVPKTLVFKMRHGV